MADLTEVTPLSPSHGDRQEYNTNSGRVFQGSQEPYSSSASVKQLIGEFPEEEETGPVWFKDYLRPCVAEFFAVMVFVFVGTLSVVTGTPIGIAIGHGFTIALMIGGIGPVSGGHINPAVTLGVVLGGGCGYIKGLLYVLFQLVGSLVGAGWARGVLSYIPDDPLSNPNNLTQYALIGGAAHTVPAGVPPGLAFVAEVGLTMVLVMTVLMTAVNTDGKNVIHPLCIGFAVVVDILAGMKVSGASMNPARSFGPAVLMTGIANVWTDHWVYWVGPAVGAIVAASFFRLILGRPDKRLIFKED